MDKKLLLTIQQECNRQNIPLPWTEIGETMGPLISGGAVVQHLSKLRIRMVAQDLPVPPPLKRGGGTRISTGPSLPRRPAQVSLPTTARGATIKDSGKPVNKKRALADLVSDDSEDESSRSDAEPDAEYGKTLVKRARPAVTQRHQSPPRKSDSAESSEDNSEDEAESGGDGNVNRVVAAGADFLTLEDDVPTKRSKIVTLKTVIKQEPYPAQESDIDEGDQSEDEAASASEDQANAAAEALEAISHISTQAANYAGNNSSHGIPGQLSGSHSYFTSANTMTNPEIVQPISTGDAAFGGLPILIGPNTPTFQNTFDSIDYRGGQVNSEGQIYPETWQNSDQYITHDEGYNGPNNQTFDLAPILTNTVFPSNLSFHGSSGMALSPYDAHSSPGLYRSYQRHGHQASLSGGTFSSSSAGPQTITPVDGNGDNFFTSAYDHNHQDLDLFANEEIDNVSYGSYRNGALPQQPSS